MHKIWVSSSLAKHAASDPALNMPLPDDPTGRTLATTWGHMTIVDLLTFLGLPEQGAVELCTSRGRGYFNDLSQVIQASQAEGTASISVHPFEASAATNETSPYIEALQPRTFGAVVARFQHPMDLEGVDTEEMAVRLAAQLRAGIVWLRPYYGYLIAVVEPFDFHDDLEINQDAWLQQLKAGLQFPDALWDIVSHIPLTNGRLVQTRERTLNASVRRILYRAVPEKISQRLNRAPDSKLARLFSGRTRKLGVDQKGRELPLTPENFDYAFTRELVSGREPYRKDEVVDTLWNRPGCAIREKGLARVEEFVETVIEEVRQRKENRPRAPTRTLPQFGPSETLREHLHGLYFVISESTGNYVSRSDVEVAFKAEVVFRYLLEHSADFYFFDGSNETIFIADGHQVTVDAANRDYRDWFNVNVQLFTAESVPGKELTGALQTKIRLYPKTNRAEAHWGRYDPTRQILYLCFDPNHTQIIRIEAAGEDGVPKVTEQVNGVEGITLRGMHHRNQRVELTPNALNTEAWELFRREIFGGQALPDGSQDSEPNYRLISTIFDLTAMLPLHRHRPLKFHQGMQGSGKTSAAFDFATVLYGSSRTGGGEYHAAVNLLRDMSTGGPVTVQDNAESKNRRNFEQVYLVPASGKPTKIRKFYTEADEVTFLPNGSLTVTAIEGMHRPEELRRTFEFVFDETYRTRRHRHDFTTRDVLLQQHADGMLSALLEVFSTHILPDFEERYTASLQWINDVCGSLYGDKRDYSDWLGRVLAVMEACGHLLVDDPNFDARSTFLQWMTALHLRDVVNKMSGSPTMTLLEAIRFEAVRLIERDDVPKVQVCGVNVRHAKGIFTIGPFTAGQIHSAFGQLAGRSRITLEEKNGRAVISRLVALSKESAFAREGWTLEKGDRDRSANAYRWTITYTSPGASGVEAGSDFSPEGTPVADSVVIP